jgi:hypothetical protein
MPPGSYNPGRRPCRSRSPPAPWAVRAARLSRSGAEEQGFGLDLWPRRCLRRPIAEGAVSLPDVHWRDRRDGRGWRGAGSKATAGHREGAADAVRFVRQHGVLRRWRQTWRGVLRWKGTATELGPRERVQAGRQWAGPSPRPSLVDRSGEVGSWRLRSAVRSRSGEGATVADGHPRTFDTS